MQSIRVMHVVETMEVGGMENGLVNLSNHINRDKFDFQICCTGKEGCLAGRIKNKEKVVTALNACEGIQFQLIKQLSAFFKERKVHIVHTHGWGSRSFVAIIAARLAKIPVVVNGEHGYIFREKKRQVILQYILTFFTDGILSVSEGLKIKLVSALKYPSGKMKVIPNGVDIKKFTGDYPTGKMMEEFKIGEKDFIVGVVGSLKYQKRQSTVCKAVARQIASGKNIKLLLIGDGPDKRDIEELVKRLGIIDNVLLLGNRDDIHQPYSLMDCIVVASIPDHEGMSNVMLEAMASGVVVISSKTIGAEELIEDGVTGVLVGENEMENGISSEINSLIANRDKKLNLAANARRLIHTNFSIEKMARDYETYYANLYKKKTGNELCAE